MDESYHPPILTATDISRGRTMLNRIFRLAENNTTVRVEIIAGITTFLTMAYIIFVNPAVLATDFAGEPTGLDPQAVMLATCIAAAVATIIMGLYARYPIAQAPGMGNNHFFVTVVMGLTALGITNAWEVALGIVFISGFTFLLLSVLRVRQAVIDALSPSLRSGISVGIGLFITFIGLRNGQIVIGEPGTLVGLNADLFASGPGVFMIGLLVISVLHARRIIGSILIGVLVAAATAWFLGEVETPSAIFGVPQIENPAIGRMDLRTALTLACVPFIIMFVFTDMFDTVGTLVGVTERAGFMKDGRLPRANRALVSDAIGTMVGATLGTSTVTSYIESAAGVEQGGRTGLTGVVVAVLFLLALFMSPLIALVASFPPITAPALVVVGVFMAQNVKRVAWDDITESLPAFLIMLGIPLTYSIADGLAIGFVVYPVLKLLSGRGGEVKLLMYILAAVMLAYFIFVRAQMG